MSQLTVFLARSIGLFCVLLAVALLVRGGTLVEATVADGPAMFVFGTISLAMGLAMVLGHNVWSGGALPVVVTLLGWSILAKGFMLLVMTPAAYGRLVAQMHYGEHQYLYVLPALLLGLYLTWAGFRKAQVR